MTGAFRWTLARGLVAGSLAAAGAMAGCDGARAELFVDLKTDFVAGYEFVGVRTEVFRAPPRPADVAPAGNRVDQPATGGEPWLLAERVAELAGLEHGSHWVRVRLFDPLGLLVAERIATVDVRGDVLITLVISRDCAGVVCPQPDGPAGHSTCSGGRCVDPACSVEHPERCGDAECMIAADCAPPAVPCAEAACTDGVCLAVARAGGCTTEAWCDPDRGCRPRDDPADAGAPDAGPPDAGAPDVGPPDAGPAVCGFATCRSDGAPCGTCGDGLDGPFTPTMDTMLSGGLHRFSSVTIPAGVTVWSVGGEALRIYSRGPVVIAGTLDLSGAGGAAVECRGGAPSVRGGAPGPGGGAGGDSGNGETTASRQGHAGAGPGAGQPSIYIGGPGGGGGGAGSSAAGSPGGDGVCNGRCSQPDQTGGPGGAAYAAIDDGSTFAGGSGGAGGTYGNSDNSTGGAGGGGGGALLIIAPTIEVSGAIRANGGNGGPGGGAVAGRNCDGGGGGGGSGGTIWLRASGVELTGALEVRGGTGGPTGVGGSSGVPGPGGNASIGQIRIDALELAGDTMPPAVRGMVLCDDPTCP